VSREHLSLKTQALRLMVWQWLVIMSLALLVLLVQGMREGISALLGGFCYWLPTCIFAIRIFAKTGARAAKQFMIVFFIGEMAKLFLSAVLFLLVASYLPLQVVWMMVGYIGAILSFWIVCGWSMREQP